MRPRAATSELLCREAHGETEASKVLFCIVWPTTHKRGGFAIQKERKFHVLPLFVQELLFLCKIIDLCSEFGGAPSIEEADTGYLSVELQAEEEGTAKLRVTNEKGVVRYTASAGRHIAGTQQAV
jgi:hypothetical protein